MEETDSSSRRIFCHFHYIRVQKWLGFLFVFFQTSYMDSVKKLGQHLMIFGCLGDCYSTESLGNFICSFIQNRFSKFYSHLGIAINVDLLVSKVC